MKPSGLRQTLADLNLPQDTQFYLRSWRGLVEVGLLRRPGGAGTPMGSIPHGRFPLKREAC